MKVCSFSAVMWNCYSFLLISSIDIPAASWLFTVGIIEPMIEFTIDWKLGRFMLISDLMIYIETDIR